MSTDKPSSEKKDKTFLRDWKKMGGIPLGPYVKIALKGVILTVPGSV